jgi:transposase-like protein
MLYRWVEHYAPEMEKAPAMIWKPFTGYTWRVEAYVKSKMGTGVSLPGS